MTPSEAQQDALNALEQVGGKPVVLHENPTLPNPAKIHIASATEPVHVLTYNPTAALELPYFVCFQCAMAERALRSAADERFSVASTSETYSRVQKLVRQKKTIPEQSVASYSQMITDGLGTQLRSMPIGIRIDRALYDNRPELRALQRTATERILKEHLKCLHPGVRGLAPELFLNASLGMNAAYAIAWSRLCGGDSQVVPYTLAGFADLGKTLVDSLDSFPDSPTYDRALVVAWSQLLRIDHLYEVGPVGL
jgi:hypothetical protein